MNRKRPFPSRPTAVALALAAAGAGSVVPARAETAAADAPPAEITVWGRAFDLVGTAQSGSQGVVGYADFQDRPISRAGELLEVIPGMIATQHSGEGKANQYFLRGFNLDHGTDFASFIDGVPANLRTHGHGQGYTDLNFLIPELVEKVEYRKGPYFADAGDFSAAGTARFRTYDALPRSFAEATVGEYGHYRGLAAGSLALGGGTLLAGAEAARVDGPWVLDEHLRKYNGLLKYSRQDGERYWNLALSAYDNQWDSTDQVPLRALRSGLIPRYGYIDPSLGGETSRLALSSQMQFGDTALNLYALHYELSLVSNFTYYLEDPVNGDEFEQKDERSIFGGALAQGWDLDLAGRPARLRAGGELRYDDIGKVGLYQTVAGRRIDTVREDSVDELSVGAYAELETHLTPSVRAVVGLRGDVYDYDVDARTQPLNSGSGTDAMISPKLALAWRTGAHTELYANYGEGFHSNDVRGASIRVDPRDPASAAERVDVLVRARGAELGLRYGAGPLNLSLVGFWLDLGSELVYSGDGGTTEPNAASRRYGTEFAGFWQPLAWLTLDLSAAYTDARFRDVPKAEDEVPNAVKTVLGAGAVVDFGYGFKGTARLRYLGRAPLIEDGSVESDPTTIVNLGAYYERSVWRVALDLYNALDARDADITYYYASRLPGESEGVDDIHLHPVEPRQLRASLRMYF
ncbi:TonB-dependent receptor [Solimonas flava]|uniref:TonB-dependent receptor n=1 Tax=Solimonas flava TaxID=415849 RepID=UPI00042A180E|nr:TonB-dependent receptor [Solimonas flava]